jgi:hypothetical protein
MQKVFPHSFSGTRPGRAEGAWVREAMDADCDVDLAKQKPAFEEVMREDRNIRRELAKR